MGRFSLKKILGGVARVATGGTRLVTEPDATWLAWADSHGFEYQLDGSDLAGRYFELAPDRPGTGEQYYGVVRGTWNDRPFTYFQRKTWGDVGTEPGPQFMAALVLQLPGAPRADLLAMEPAKAFAAAGGELPRTGSFMWHPLISCSGVVVGSTRRRSRASSRASPCSWRSLLPSSGSPKPRPRGSSWRRRLTLWGTGAMLPLERASRLTSVVAPQQRRSWRRRGAHPRGGAPQARCAGAIRMWALARPRTPRGRATT